MKKHSLHVTLALVFGLLAMTVAGIAAIIGSNSKITNAVGVTQLTAHAANLDSVTIGDLAGGAVTVKVYDSASAVTTVASQLKYTFAIPVAMTQTAWNRTIPLGAHFNNGIVVTTDGQTNTLTAMWHYVVTQ